MNLTSKQAPDIEEQLDPVSETSSLEYPDSIKPVETKTSWANVLYLSFTSLGAIYGDIGTSPLYTFTTIFSSETPPAEDVYGAMSCLFWVFTLVVMIKYCFIVLIMGPNNGEGGQVAIYAKIARTLKIGPQGVELPGEVHTDDLLLITRNETMDSAKRSVKSGFYGGRFNDTLIEKFVSKFIMGLCFVGCGLVISDGLLTPTTSVLSAISGISVAAPSFSDKVLPVSCVILIVLFLIQRYGASKISILFAPIIFIWLSLLFVNGVICIVDHPLIFKSLNPAEAIYFLKRKKDIDILGSIMLAITGAELMFADVGHFSALSIQLALGVFVYPCLMFAYLGQGAYLINHPEALPEVFFVSIPGGLNTGYYWFVFVIATLASIIASQALILSVFSILRQMIHIDCFPKFKIIHLSSKHFGQIYIPMVNFILMVLVVCTCVGFKNSNKVTAAYGLGVALDFFVTTNLISICMLYFYNLPIAVVVVFYLVFGAIDMVLIIAGLKKVPHGAWFPLMMAIIMFLFICFWRWGRSLKVQQEYNDRVKLREIFDFKSPLNTTVKIGSLSTYKADDTSDIELDGSVSLVAKLPRGELVNVTRYEGVAVMYTDVMHTLNSPNTVPALFKHIITSFPAIPKTFLFLGIRVSSVPRVPEQERILLEPMRSVPGFYRCVIKYGFLDRIQVTDAIIAEIVTRIHLSEVLDEEVPINIKETTRDHMFQNGRLNCNVLHIFEKEVVTAQQFRDKVQDAGKLHKLVLKSGIYIRSMLIERCYGSLASMFQSVEKSVNVSEDQEVLFVGNKVEL